MKALYTIFSPIVTEKATKLAESQTYMFYVNPKATKIEIKQAIKEIYGHDVAKVRSINAPAKKKLYRRTLVDKRPEMKKVMVVMKGRKKLDFTKVGKEPKK